MPKILHIGGADSPHVIGIMEQVKKLTGFDQALLSYPANIKKFDIEFLKNIPQYYYNYPIFFTRKPVPDSEEKKVSRFVEEIVHKEKPDIIHGHYLSKCAVPMYYAMQHSKKPGIVVPWSTWDIPNIKNTQMIYRIQRCIDRSSYVMCTNLKFLNALLKAFHQPRSKLLFSSSLVRLMWYKDSYPDVTKPRIYVPRGYYQEIIFKAFPKIIKLYPGIQITALSTPAMQNFAKKLGIYDKMTFIPHMLPQEEFSKMIKKHNIILSMAPDGGTGGTTTQSAYFGAVTIVHYSPWATDIFKDEQNVLCCAVDKTAIENKIIYAIQNLEKLCKRFKQNNAFLEEYDENVTGKNLVSAYKKLLGVRG